MKPWVGRCSTIRAIDPWIRTHQRLGATILCPAHGAMTITGTVAEWEEWTDMAFPESGH
jgi:hypothetical protein